MRHDQDLADQDVEELAEVLWRLGEEGRDRVDEVRAAVCPHGKPIPSDVCCHTLQALEALVQPLDRLPVGRDGRIVYIAPREPARLARLGSLGIVPGVVVHLQQKSPAAVIRVGETTLALDPAIAGEIYVKRVG